MSTPKSEYKDPFTLRCYTRKELAELYKIPYITLKRWVSAMPLELEMRKKRLLNIVQVKAIVEKYGIPGDIVLK